MVHLELLPQGKFPLRSFQMMQKKSGDYHRWTNVSVGGGADVGGSCGIGYTWVPFTW